MASEGKVAVLAALFGNLAIALLKLAAGLVAGSAAMLAEAAHSFSDVGNQILLLLGLARAKAGPTEAHPFGRGKSAYFWPFLVAVLLFGVAGTYSMLEGIEKFRHPHELGDIRFSLIVLGIAFVIESVSLGVAVRSAVRQAKSNGITTIRRFISDNRDATLLTVVVEDGVALVGLPLVAAALLLADATANPLWDAAGSAVIGGILMGFAIFLGWSVRGLLVGRGLSPMHNRRVRSIVQSDRDVVGVLTMQSMHMGADVVMLGIEVDLRNDLPGAAIEVATRRIEQNLRNELPILRYIYIEVRDQASTSIPALGY